MGRNYGVMEMGRVSGEGLRGGGGVVGSGLVKGLCWGVRYKLGFNWGF